MMIDPIKKFVADMRADEELAPLADEMERALKAADLLADGNDHLAAQFAGIEWFIKQPKPLRERFNAIIKFVSLKGQGVVRIPSLLEFAGWK